MHENSYEKVGELLTRRRAMMGEAFALLNAPTLSVEGPRFGLLTFERYPVGNIGFVKLWDFIRAELGNQIDAVDRELSSLGVNVKPIEWPERPIAQRSEPNGERGQCPAPAEAARREAEEQQP